MNIFASSKLHLRAFSLVITFFVTLSSVQSFSQTSVVEEAHAKMSDLASLKWGTHKAEDGFITAYLELTPKNQVITNTAVLIHGFSKDGLYWLDFVRATHLLEQGYRVLLPDLMFRGRTQEINFPILEKDGDHWVPNDWQMLKMSQGTPEQMASYLHQLLRYKQEEWAKEVSSDKVPAQPLLIAGHSHGHAVSANLLYLMGKENLQLQKQKKSLRWNVQAHWSFNGFVAYSSPAIMDLEAPSAGASYFNRSQKKSIEMYAQSLQALSLREDVEVLRNQTLRSVDPNDPARQEKLQRQQRAHANLENSIPFFVQPWVPNFEGTGESFFVHAITQELEEKLQTEEQAKGSEDFKTRYIKNKALIDREAKLMQSLMEGLRARYEVQVDSNGRETFFNKKLFVPSTVLGIYKLVTRGDFPGMPKELNVIQGAADIIVPEKLSRHLEAISQFEPSSGANKAAVKFQTLPGGHYGPEAANVQNLFAGKIGLIKSTLRCEAVLSN